MKIKVKCGHNGEHICPSEFLVNDIEQRFSTKQEARRDKQELSRVFNTDPCKFNNLSPPFSTEAQAEIH